jgi:hypothetical protein
LDRTHSFTGVSRGRFIGVSKKSLLTKEEV